MTSREYYAAHREERRASARASYQRHREERLAKAKVYAETHREQIRARYKAYTERPEVKAHRFVRHQEWYWRNHEKCLAYARARHRVRRAKLRALHSVDCRAYAEYRFMDRLYCEFRAVRAGRAYWPRRSRRIPDWATFGQSVLVAKSKWLIENRSAGAAGWARELQLERLKNR